MSLTITQYPGPPIGTNAYLVIDDATKRALVIDAPWQLAGTIRDAAAAVGATIETIFLTHAHWDHIGDAAVMQREYAVPVVAHRLQLDRLAAPGSSIMRLPVEIPPVTPDRLVDEGDTVTLGSTSFRVLHLPGHDPGHIALWSEADGVLLSGDVLFPNGHGRIDIPGANADDMARSLARLADFPPATVVYPGHGDPTTIAAEGWLAGFREAVTG